MRIFILSQTEIHQESKKIHLTDKCEVVRRAYTVDFIVGMLGAVLSEIVDFFLTFWTDKIGNKYKAKCKSKK